MSQIKTRTITLLLLLFSHWAWAGSSNNVWSKRADSRASKRWTLQEWMTQKEKMALMDQWLVMNSPSPFEVSIKGYTNSYKLKEGTNPEESQKSAGGAFSAYAQSIGLTGEYDNHWDENINDVSGMLNIRILGNSLQTTSLTLHVGQRTRQLWNNSEQETLKNVLGQISLQAYLTRHFGIQGSYRHYFPTKNSALGDVDGTLTEGGIFIDFGGLRVFGSWYQDQHTENLNAVESESKRTGYKTGLQIFF